MILLVMLYLSDIQILKYIKYINFDIVNVVVVSFS